MIKLFFTLLNLSFLLMVSDIKDSPITVIHDFPEKATPGTEFVVTMTVNKGEMNEYGKFTMNLPEGLTAESVDANDGSFTFNDQKIIIIWLNLPAEDEFDVKYKVMVSKDAFVDTNIKGKFSALYQNDRITANTTPTYFFTGGEEFESDVPVAAVATGNRSIKDMGNGEYEVTVSIEKENVSGFAKLEENLPASVNVEAIETEKAVFSRVGDKAKFVWMKLPEGNFEVKYKANGDGDVIADLNAASGEFSYLDDNETKKTAIATGDQVEQPAMADNNEDNTEADEPTPAAETNEEENLATQPESEDDTEDTTEEATTEETEEENAPKGNDFRQVDQPESQPDEPVTAEVEDEPEVPKNVVSTPAPQTGIVYRVQICAGHKTVKQDHFKKVYKYDGDFFTENHQGWIKYTKGKFMAYNDARDDRENLGGYKFPGPFVTAYNSGERITVQEALMITNQKWVK